MKTVIHRAASRGYADHGWLQTHHTFSFARYYDPTRMGFGALRVLNDDTVAGGEGFGPHPHDNMEIVSIPLEGSLRHGDSMGHSQIIGPGKIQVMSAGTGVIHSEYNASEEKPVKFLQIWVLPDKTEYSPRYETIELLPARPNTLRTIVTPDDEREKGAGRIHQQAWFRTLDLVAGHKHDYAIGLPGNCLYVFVIEGRVRVAGEEAADRDGVGVLYGTNIPLEGLGDARLLLMDIPM